MPKWKRIPFTADMLIVGAYKNLLETSASIARRFHVSDSHAHEVFDRYVKLDRLPLTDAISVDEVFLDMDDNCKYALVIPDFHTRDPIDLLCSRRATVTEPYFVSISAEERGAVPVVDSFHVIQWITRMIDNYIRQLIRKFHQPVPLPLSNEVYLFQKFGWLVLANQSNIRYRSDPRMDPHSHVLMNTYDYRMLCSALILI